MHAKANMAHKKRGMPPRFNFNFNPSEG